MTRPRVLAPLPAHEFDYPKAQHLLNRAGFGGTPDQVRALVNAGLDRAVDSLLEFRDVDVEPVRADQFDSTIMRPRTSRENELIRRAREAGDEATLDAARADRQARQAADRKQIQNVREWWLNRLIESPRPLQEKMTLFWHGHFATGYRGTEDSFHMFRQNQLFRRFATGNFKQLTHQIIRDPAMLRYLNNNQNSRRAPNENLARELMELFTLGEGNGYTEDDIKDGTRALTGYTYADDQFVLQPKRHDADPKTILGRTGNWDGDDFLDLVFTMPTAPAFLCWKLYRFFVNDLPGTPDEESRGVIEAMSTLFKREQFNVKPVLSALLRSRHFYADANTTALIKSPVQLVIQAIRSLAVPRRELRVLLNGMDVMGQSLLFPPSVKGWSGGRAWINTSTLYVRQNLLVYMLTGRRHQGYRWERDGSTYDATHLVRHLRGVDGAIPVRSAVLYLLRFCLGREPGPGRAGTLVSFVESNGGRIDNDMIVALLALITALPEYQLC